ncbi:MAG: gliding motility lipoprotein GldB [Flavobacteriaceae bacterium]|nr:gliding motility lipoprotein GldB [Flavobacteriaceae bacterium]
MKKISIYFLISLVFISCKTDSKIDNEIALINADFEVERFDQIFMETSPENLPELKADYPFMFSRNFNDSVWIRRMQDSLQIELKDEVQATFGNFETEYSEIELLFKHLKYHFKEFKIPRVITVTSDVDYRNKVIATDSIVLLALDNYLGSEHKFYDGIQQYLKLNFRKEMLVSDMAEAYASNYIYQSNSRTFLDDMIYSGKLLYFKDVIIPFKSDAIKIGYREDQLEWAQANESYIWRYFVEKELLYSTDPKLAARFINPAPFSKFNLELDRESPGRLGQYIGWQIVRAYMENTDSPLKQLLTANAEDIFKNSRFKPRK